MLTSPHVYLALTRGDVAGTLSFRLASSPGVLLQGNVCSNSIDSNLLSERHYDPLPMLQHYKVVWQIHFLLMFTSQSVMGVSSSPASRVEPFSFLISDFLKISHNIEAQRYNPPNALGNTNYYMANSLTYHQTWLFSSPFIMPRYWLQGLA